MIIGFSPAWRGRFFIAVIAAFALALASAPNALAADFLQPATSPELSQAGPAGMATGDIDNDGDQDIVASNAATTASSLVNNGVGDFREVTVASNAATIDVGLGKFDGDTTLDLVVLYPGTPPSVGGLAIFKGNGDGSFTFLGGTNATVSTGVRPTQIWVEDFNGNGTDDVAVVNSQNTPTTTAGTLMVFLGNPANNDTFAAATPFSTTTLQLGATSLIAEEFDGGARDLLVSNFQSNSVSFLSGLGTGAFAAPFNVGTVESVFYLDVENLNGDSIPDTVATVRNSSPSKVRIGGGSQTTVSVAASTAHGTSPQQPVLRDFDNDSDVDLAVANGATVPAGPGTVSTLSNNGTGTLTIDPTSPETNVGPSATTPFGIVSADFDGSGFNDLAVSNLLSTPGAVSTLLNQGGDQANLSISKTDSPDPVNATQNVTYALTVSNASAITPTSVKVTDTLPAGLTFDAGASAPACSAVGQVVTCDYGSVANGTPETLNVVATATGAVTGPVSNTTTVGANRADPASTNNADSETTTINPAADLVMSKAAPAGPVQVGDSFNYTLSVQNTGPNGATNAVVSDSLPANVDFVSATAPCAETAPGSNVVSCNVGAIANGGNAGPYQVTVTALSPGNPVNNTASVTASEFDPSTANNSSTASLEIRADADLQIDKSGPATVHVGESFTYTLATDNAGPSDATNVVVTDTLPAEVSYNDAGSDSRCEETTLGSGVVECNLGAVAAADPADQLTIAATAATATAAAQNSAAIDGDEDDTVPANNSDSVTTEIRAAADLSIVKSDDVDPVHVGDDITYTLNLANAGPSDATNVVVTDTLPAEVTYDDAASDSRCDETAPASGVVECTTAVLAASGNDSFAIVVSADDPATPATNTATVDADEDDTVPANNTDSEDTTILPVAGLAITKSDSPDPAHVGGEITYTLGVGNGGPNASGAVVVTDTLPAEVSYNDAASDSRCDETLPGIVACNLGTIAGTASDSADVVVSADTPAAAASNSASVVGLQFDPDLSDNTDTETTEIRAAADLAITKSDPGSDPVFAGEEIEYLLSVTNDGPSDATDVNATDVLPAGLTFNTAGSSPECTAVGPTVTCDYGPVADGATETRTVVVTTDAATVPSVDNTASVDADEDDLVAGNDSDLETTMVNPSTDLSVSKADSADPVTLGASITYTLQVQNDGPSDATDVAVTDPLPAGLTFEAAGSSVQCSAVGQMVICTFGTVPNGAGVSRTVMASTSGAAVPSVSNWGVVEGDEFDPQLLDNFDAETTVVDDPTGGDGVGGTTASRLNTTIDKVKRARRGRKIKFFFSSTIPGSRFECGIDFDALVSCRSPEVIKTESAGPGKHTFTVRAIAPDGTIERTAATTAFKLKKKK